MAPVFGPKDHLNLLEGNLAAGDIEDRAHDIADHFVEKSVGFKFEVELIVVFDDIESDDCADCIARSASAMGFVGK